MLLDGLFLLTGLLLLPIGFGRGVQREVFVTAALLAGTTLSAAWARPWGQDLADAINVRTGAGQFSISAAFLIGSVVVLGYGGSAAARVERAGLSSRMAGAVLAVINGGLIASLLLRDIERFLADAATERSLKESIVAWTLLRQFGWVVLGAGLVVLVLISVSLISNRQGALVAGQDRSGGRAWQRSDRVDRGRKRRLGWGRDDGKVEPRSTAFDGRTGRYGADAPRFQETMPIAPVDSSMWSVDRARGAFVGGSEWLQIATEPPGPAGTPVDPVTVGAASEAIRCVGCGERLRGEDAFCPRCGRGLY